MLFQFLLLLLEGNTETSSEALIKSLGAVRDGELILCLRETNQSQSSIEVTPAGGFSIFKINLKSADKQAEHAATFVTYTGGRSDHVLRVRDYAALRPVSSLILRSFLKEPRIVPLAGHVRRNFGNGTRSRAASGRRVVKN